MGIDDVIALRNDGAVLLDSREPNDFAAGHLRGAINVGLQRRFAEYAGDVLAPTSASFSSAIRLPRSRPRSASAGSASTR